MPRRSRLLGRGSGGSAGQSASYPIGPIGNTHGSAALPFSVIPVVRVALRIDRRRVVLVLITGWSTLSSWTKGRVGCFESFFLRVVTPRRVEIDFVGPPLFSLGVLPRGSSLAVRPMEIGFRERSRPAGPYVAHRRGFPAIRQARRRDSRHWSNIPPGRRASSGHPNARTTQ